MEINLSDNYKMCFREWLDFEGINIIFPMEPIEIGLDYFQN